MKSVESEMKNLIEPLLRNKGKRIKEFQREADKKVHHMSFVPGLDDGKTWVFYNKVTFLVALLRVESVEGRL